MRYRFPTKVPVGKLASVLLSGVCLLPVLMAARGWRSPTMRSLAVTYLLVWAGLSVGLAVAGWVVDRWRKVKAREGVQLRGPRLLTRYEFNREVRGDGYGIRLDNPTNLLERMQGEKGKVLRIKRRDENRNLIAIGDPGSGKTLLLMQIMDEHKRRREPMIVYDPHLQFVPRYFDAAAGDVILNPLDVRCPAWRPADEIIYDDAAIAEAMALAQGTSLFPVSGDSKNLFFERCCQVFWQYCHLHFRPSPEEMAYLMAHADPLIHEVIKGTELEAMIPDNSPGQFSGIMGHMAQVAFALRQIPKQEPGRSVFCLRDWCQTRQHSIFITNNQETREALRPIQSMMLDSVIRSLLSMGEREDLPAVLMVIDELQTLQRLPQLMPLMTEGRKSLKVALGLHGRSEVKALYPEYEAMLSAARTKFMLATSEPEAAKWLSESVGDIEVERLRETRPADMSKGMGGHTFSSDEPRRETLLLPSEFMGLEERTGYLKYGDRVVPIEIPILPKIQNAAGFIPRVGRAPVKRMIPDLAAVKLSRAEAAREALKKRLLQDLEIKEEIVKEKQEKEDEERQEKPAGNKPPSLGNVVTLVTPPVRT